MWADFRSAHHLLFHLLTALDHWKDTLWSTGSDWFHVMFPITCSLRWIWKPTWPTSSKIQAQNGCYKIIKHHEQIEVQPPLLFQPNRDWQRTPVLNSWWSARHHWDMEVSSWENHRKTGGPSNGKCLGHFAEIPSGKLTVCYWKWLLIVSFPIKNGDFPVRYVSLPEGKSFQGPILSRKAGSLGHLWRASKFCHRQHGGPGAEDFLGRCLEIVISCHFYMFKDSLMMLNVLIWIKHTSTTY